MSVKRNNKKTLSGDFRKISLEETLNNFNIFDFYSNISAKEESLNIFLDLRVLMQPNIQQIIWAEGEQKNEKNSSENFENEFCSTLISSGRGQKNETDLKKNFENELLCCTLIYLLENNYSLKLLAILKLKRAQYYQEALENIEELLLRKPHDLYLFLEKQNLLHLLNRDDESATLQATIDEIHKSHFNVVLPSKYVNALSCMVEDKFEEALLIFNEIIISHPNDIHCIYYRFFCLLNLNRHQKNFYLNFTNCFFDRSCNGNQNYDDKIEIFAEFVVSLLLSKLYEHALKWVDFAISKNIFKNESNINKTTLLKSYCLLMNKKFKEAYIEIKKIYNTGILNGQISLYLFHDYLSAKERERYYYIFFIIKKYLAMIVN